MKAKLTKVQARNKGHELGTGDEMSRKRRHKPESQTIWLVWNYYIVTHHVDNQIQHHQPNLATCSDLQSETYRDESYQSWCRKLRSKACSELLKVNLSNQDTLPRSNDL